MVLDNGYVKMDILILDFTGKKNRIISKLINQFLLGMEGTGVVPKIVHIDELRIVDCKGCTEDINFVSNGDCICEDDFRLLYPQFRRSENFVFIFDLENKSLWQKLFSAMNRMEPLYDFSLNSNQDGATKNIFALIFSAGNTNSTLGTLINEMETFSLLIGGKFNGYAYRPNYYELNMFDDELFKNSKFSEAFFEAGTLIAHNKPLDPTIISRIGSKIFEENSLLNEIYQNFYKRTHFD